MGPPAGEHYVMAARVSPFVDQRQMRINGAILSLLTSGTDMAPNAVLPLCLGQGFAPNLNNTTLDGAIGEVLFFDRHLSDAEFDFVYEYIESKWGAN